MNTRTKGKMTLHRTKANLLGRTLRLLGILIPLWVIAAASPARAASEQYKLRLDAVAGVFMAPFGVFAAEVAGSGTVIPNVFVDGRVGGAVGGSNGQSSSGEWLRGKAGFLLAEEHAVYVPIEVFHQAIQKIPHATFFNTGLGYRYFGRSSGRWFLLDGELDYTVGRGGDRNGLGALVAAELGGENLFTRIEGGCFSASSKDAFTTSFRFFLALGWHISQ
jgi:hypothetical protein